MNIQSISGINISGKVVIVKEEAFKPEYQSIHYRIVRATGGFGCSPNTLGSAVFVKNLCTGEEDRLARQDFQGWITDEEAELIVSAYKSMT